MECVVGAAHLVLRALVVAFPGCYLPDLLYSCSRIFSFYVVLLLAFNVFKCCIKLSCDVYSYGRKKVMLLSLRQSTFPMGSGVVLVYTYIATLNKNCAYALLCICYCLL